MSPCHQKKKKTNGVEQGKKMKILSEFIKMFSEIFSRTYYGSLKHLYYSFEYIYNI